MLHKEQHFRNVFYLYLRIETPRFVPATCCFYYSFAPHCPMCRAATGGGDRVRRFKSKKARDHARRVAQSKGRAAKITPPPGGTNPNHKADFFYWFV